MDQSLQWKLHAGLTEIWDNKQLGRIERRMFQQYFWSHLKQALYRHSYFQVGFQVVEWVSPTLYGN